MNSRSDLNKWVSALRRILDLDASVVIPGHWGKSNRQAVAKLELFATRVKELKAKRYSKEEVKDRPGVLDLPKLIAETGIQRASKRIT